jgi:hypothetical protein
MRTNTATTVYDEYGTNTGAAVNGVLFGSAYGTRDEGGDLDGSNDYIGFGLAVDDTLGAGFTIAGWLKRDSINRVDTIMSNYNGNNATTSLRDGIAASVQPDNKVYVYLVDSGGGNYKGRYTTDTLASNTWYHVTVTWGGSFTSTNFSLYIDGQKKDTTTSEAGTVNSFDHSDRPMEIGRELGQSGYTGYFDGSVDEVGIWSRALSSNEVFNLYNIPLYAPYKP